MTDVRTGAMIRITPNALSCARIVLALALPIVDASDRLWIVLGAGVTDLLDGAIARRFGATSALGGLLDAIADKMFVVSALLTFWNAGAIAWWQIPIVLARDLVVLSAAIRAVSARSWSSFLQMPPGLAGKLTTGFLFAWLVALAAQLDARFVLAMFVLTALASLAAAGDYGWRLARALAEDRARRSAS